MTDLTDDEADVVDDYTYDVFGAIRSQPGSSDNYWLFTGEQEDADSPLTVEAEMTDVPAELDAVERAMDLE